MPRERSHTSELQLSLGDLLAGEADLQKELNAAVNKAQEAAGGEPEGPTGQRPKPKGRRNLLLSDLPRVVIEILDEERERPDSGCRRIGFEDSRQLMFQRGGFSVLVKRVAKYEVTKDGETTVESVPTPETLFPRALLHTSTIAHLLTSKFSLGVPHYRLEQVLTEQGVPLDRSTMCRYVEHAGNVLGATIVHAMWQHALEHGNVISSADSATLPATATSQWPSTWGRRSGYHSITPQGRQILCWRVTHQRHRDDTVHRTSQPRGFRGGS